MRLEPYASTIFLSEDIDDTLNLDKFFVIGSTFRFNAYPLTCWVEDISSLKRNTIGWIKDVNLDINLVKGHNFKGWNDPEKLDKN